MFSEHTRSLIKESIKKGILSILDSDSDIDLLGDVDIVNNLGITYTNLTQSKQATDFRLLAIAGIPLPNLSGQRLREYQVGLMIVEVINELVDAEMQARGITNQTPSSLALFESVVSETSESRAPKHESNASTEVVRPRHTRHTHFPPNLELDLTTQSSSAPSPEGTHGLPTSPRNTETLLYQQQPDDNRTPSVFFSPAVPTSWSSAQGRPPMERNPLLTPMTPMNRG